MSDCTAAVRKWSKGTQLSTQEVQETSLKGRRDAGQWLEGASQALLFFLFPEKEKTCSDLATELGPLGERGYNKGPGRRPLAQMGRK